MAEAARLSTTVQRWEDPATGTPWLLRFHWANVDGRMTLAGFGITSIPYVPHDPLDDYPDPTPDEVEMMEGHEVSVAPLSASTVRRVAVAAEAHRSRQQEARLHRHLTDVAERAGHEAVQQEVRQAGEAWADEGRGTPGPGRPRVWGEREHRAAAAAYLDAQARGLATTAAVRDALGRARPDRQVTARVVEKVIRQAKDRGLIPTGDDQ